MNPLYDQMFNPNYVNEQYYYSMQEKQVRNEREINKAVKAIHDYCEAVRSIEPEYQQEAFRRCVAAILGEMNR